MFDTYYIQNLTKRKGIRTEKAYKAERTYKSR